jgi:hypothetical protein
MKVSSILNRGGVVEQETNAGLRGIAGVGFSGQSDEVRAGVVIAYDFGYATGLHIEASQ